MPWDGDRVRGGRTYESWNDQSPDYRRLSRAAVVPGMFSSRLFRGTSKDYMLASHSIGPFLLLMSLFGTTMTAFALVGSTGEAFDEGVGVYGMLASSSGIIHSLCFFLLGVKLWSWGKNTATRRKSIFFATDWKATRSAWCCFRSWSDWSFRIC